MTQLSHGNLAMNGEINACEDAVAARNGVNLFLKIIWNPHLLSTDVVYIKVFSSYSVNIKERIEKIEKKIR